MYKKWLGKCHYPLSVIGMIVGIAIAYFAFSFASQMKREVGLEEKEFNESVATMKSMGVSLNYNQTADEILPIFKDERVTSYISSLSLFCDDMKTECLMNVYFSVPNDFSYYVVKGSMPTKEQLQAHEKVVVLGKGLKRDTFRKGDEDYYRICGEEYRVTGYISAEKSKALDSIRMLFYDGLGEKTKTEIDYNAASMGIMIFLKSDTQNLMDIYNEKNELLKNKVLNIQFMNDAWDDTFVLDIGLMQYQQYAYLLYFFAILLVIMITELWITQRKKEFAIRRAVGYSRIQIAGMVSVDLLKMIVGSGVIFLMLQILMQYFTQTIGNTSEWIEDIGICILFIVCTFLLLMIYPLYKIMHGSIAEVIQEKGV